MIKQVLGKIVESKTVIVRTLFLAGIILVSLPSCKHHGATCDAYQGSTRSLKKKKRHADVIRLHEVINKA